MCDIDFVKVYMLTLCMLGKFSCFLYPLLFLFSIFFPKKFSQEHYQLSNILDPDDGPDLGPYCLQILSAYKISPASKEMVKPLFYFRNSIHITTPEESFTLTTQTPALKVLLEKFSNIDTFVLYVLWGLIVLAGRLAGS